jgi:hypothetical protein
VIKNLVTASRQAGGQARRRDTDIENTKGGQPLRHGGDLGSAFFRGESRKCGQSTAHAANPEGTFGKLLLVAVDADDGRLFTADSDSPTAPLGAFELKGLLTGQRRPPSEKVFEISG